MCFHLSAVLVVFCGFSAKNGACPGPSEGRRRRDAKQRDQRAVVKARTEREVCVSAGWARDRGGVSGRSPKCRQKMKRRAASQNHNIEKPTVDTRDHSNDVMIGALEKDGENMMKIVEEGGMVAILSGMEIMYVFVYNGQYQCFIHEFDAPEGRHKAWDMDERNRAMLKNLPSAADQLFEVKGQPDMHYMGVMVAAERGIIDFLDYIGALPAEDQDFMAWKDKEGESR